MLNKLITFCNDLRYKLTEPVMLRLARLGWRDENEPLISIYVPTLNRPKLLIERCVKSILAQTYENWELIIIDDGSDVGYAGDPAFWNKRIYFRCLPPRKHPKSKKADWLLGPTRASNYALKLCSGKWIARNDDDDVWSPDHLEVLLKFAQKGNYEFVYGAYEEERHNKKKVIDAKWPPAIQTTLYRNYLKLFKFNKHCWRKEWDRNNDIDLPVRMRNAGVRMGFLNKVVTYVYPRPGEDTIGWEAVREKEKG
jgi:glycosyltransferase involved in cell wall biosynthesis